VLGKRKRGFIPPFKRDSEDDGTTTTTSSSSSLSRYDTLFFDLWRWGLNFVKRIIERMLQRSELRVRKEEYKM
jgi:hypothetical protein